MKVHPQLIGPMRILENLRRKHRDSLVNIRIGKRGIESVLIDGDEKQEKDLLPPARKLVDNGNAKKLD